MGSNEIGKAFLLALTRHGQPGALTCLQVVASAAEGDAEFARTLASTDCLNTFKDQILWVASWTTNTAVTVRLRLTAFDGDGLTLLTRTYRAIGGQAFERQADDCALPTAPGAPP